MSAAETSTNAVPVPRTSVPGLTVTGDNDFFFEAAKEGRLEIQRCADCKTLRHPPAPACPSCRSFSWDTVESTRRCTLHSFTVIHHPKDPAFEYPLAVGLVDLEEGTRLVADIAGIDHDDLVFGMELEVGFSEHAHGEILPQLRRRGEA
ncbi:MULTISPECIES: Zn-ribbon domain-containing OB-fold protein [Rhodococcus]|uniref:Zn-ribbon domain-containing OB-fold protein n=1 Tax=Rhodococcus TaxID=1827 RepID=UPI001201CA9F|nr:MULTISPECIES: OB-fold domain-containing protein [Rhodococcus]QXW00950.1 OB-fold domain-containing protein [Rhodococcus globerulus]RZL21900.1 MAG: acyl dehydratase [Rhodococcus sp. (in: high G+C Gram-positive bacteria)]